MEERTTESSARNDRSQLGEEKGKYEMDHKVTTLKMCDHE